MGRKLLKRASPPVLFAHNKLGCRIKASANRTGAQYCWSLFPTVAGFHAESSSFLHCGIPVRKYMIPLSEAFTRTLITVLLKLVHKLHTVTSADVPYSIYSKWA